QVGRDVGSNSEHGERKIQLLGIPRHLVKGGSYLRTMRCPNGERSAISVDRTGLLGGDHTAPPNIVV
ncbi:unnamed protein product, partial [Musa acuminata var. zebrina]